MTTSTLPSRLRASLGRTATSPSELAARIVVGLIGVVALVVLSAFFDARLTQEALTLPPETVRFAGYVSDIGLSGYMFAVSALVAIGCLLARWLDRDKRLDSLLTLLAERAIYIFATLAVSGLLAQLIKHLVGRARPPLMQSFGPYHFDFLSMKNSLASFPSGHSTTAFAMATALGLLLPRWRIPLFVLATLIAASRVAVEAHYASDIVAGGVLGVVSALAVTRFLAGMNFAFETDGDAVRPKGRGLLKAALLGRS